MRVDTDGGPATTRRLLHEHALDGGVCGAMWTRQQSWPARSHQPRVGRRPVGSEGIVTKDADPSHAQKAVYSLTGKGLDLLPILSAMSAWSQKYHPETRRPEAVRFVEGGPKALKQLESMLRHAHGITR